MGDPISEHELRLEDLPGRRRWIPKRLAVLVGGLVVLVAGAMALIASPSAHLPFTVWITPGSSIGQIHAVELASSGLPGVSGCRFRSQEWDQQEARRTLPPTAAFAQLQLSKTPSSYRCQAATESDRRAAFATLTLLKGVQSVSAPLISTP